MQVKKAGAYWCCLLALCIITAIITNILRLIKRVKVKRFLDDSFLTFSLGCLRCLFRIDESSSAMDCPVLLAKVSAVAQYPWCTR